MTITAKFATICPCCHASISPGSKVEWTKGSKARHVACAGVAAAAPVTRAAVYAARRSSYDRRGGKWTGCSCGSREDSAGDLIPSSRNCASCEHDA